MQVAVAVLGNQVGQDQDPPLEVMGAQVDKPLFTISLIIL
jgi:hypothetical protein